jgi:thioredoxin 2
MSAVVVCGSCETKNRVPEVAAGTPRCAACKQPLPWIVEADDNTFARVADSTKVPVLVDLWAVWCGPCRMVSPILAEIAAERAGRIKLVKVDVDRAPRTQASFVVKAIPTLVLLNKGVEVSRQTGALPKPELDAWLAQVRGE